LFGDVGSIRLLFIPLPKIGNWSGKIGVGGGAERGGTRVFNMIEKQRIS